MSKLKLTKPIAIITVGYPGSGKTNFARQMSAKLRSPHVSFERIRYELFQSPQSTKQEAEIINRIVYYMCDEYLKNGHSIVCDGNFSTKKSRKDFYQLLAQHGVTPLLVWVQTDLDTSYDRASSRDKRRLDDQYAGNIELDQFDQAVKEFKRPAEKEAYSVVSGKHVFKSQYKTVLRKLSIMGLLDATPIDSLSSHRTVVKIGEQPPKIKKTAKK